MGALQPELEKKRDVEDLPESQAKALTQAAQMEQELGKLHDKNRVIFGSILFITTLLVLLGTSIKFIPVWWVTVPAAVIMVARDIAQDRGRWTKKGRKELQEVDHPNNEKPTNIIQKIYFPFKFGFKSSFPTFSKILGGLPVLMLPFAFSMFILVEALTESGWIQVFSKWWESYVSACGPGDSLRALVGAIFGMLIISVLMCNVSNHLTLSFILLLT